MSCNYRPFFRVMPAFFVLFLALLATVFGQFPATAMRVAPLIDPVKIATLKGDRAANDRLLKAVYWLHEGAITGELPVVAIAAAQQKNGASNPARDELVRAQLLRNLDIAAKLGCLTLDNLLRLRRGVSPVITLGPYAGQAAEVDHIIPLAAAPQWGKEIANLELLPRELNRRKSAAFGERQLALWRTFWRAGMDESSRAPHAAPGARPS